MRRRRMEQVDEELRKALSEAVRALEGFPEGSLVTVTHVQTAPDFSYAKVLVSVLPAALGPRVLTMLERAAPRMRHALAQELPFRRMPELTWAIDREMEIVQDFEQAMTEG